MVKTIERMEDVHVVDMDRNYCGTIVVHSGVFHAHDVFASIGFSNIVRTRNPEVIKHFKQNGATVVDVGMGELDHHGWKGYRGLDTMFPDRLLVEMEEEHFTILESIAKIDCGEEAVDYVSSLISSFNPTWNESSLPEDYDMQFEKALEVGSWIMSFPSIFIALKERELAREAGKAEAASIVDQAMLESAGSALLKLPRFVPWQEKVCHYNELSGNRTFVWVLFPSPDGSWRVQAVPKAENSMEFIAPVLAQPEDKGFIFCHPNKFICGYATKDDAIKAVRTW